MCTCSLLPQAENGDFIFTVNRDEDKDREAIPPKIYSLGKVKFLMPKDREKGGSWIGVSDRKRMVNLMNGAFHPHKRNPPYRKSRGLILIDFLKTENFEKCCRSIDLNNIEPFTLVSIDWNKGLKINEFRWDGTEIYLEKKKAEMQIWSASMTYDEEQKKERSEFFKRKLNAVPRKKIKPDMLWKLHHTQRKNGEDLDLIIDRGQLQTTSITQIVKNGDKVTMNFRDLKKDKRNSVLF